MDFRGGNPLCMLTVAVEGGRDTSATEGGRKGVQKMEGQVLKASGRRTGAGQHRARWGSERQEKLEGKAAAAQVEEKEGLGWGRRGGDR